MQKFSFSSTNMRGLVLIHPKIAIDSRGFFLKVYEDEIFCEAGIHLKPYEQFVSLSKKGVLRGIHFQRHYTQDKLVHVLHGKVFDVVIDLRRHSPTFGQWEGFYLSDENQKMLYIPKGFAHGFLALEENTLFSYLCGDRYDPKSDGGIVWNDSDLAVHWPVEQVEQLIISEKDKQLPTLAQFQAQYGALDVGEDA